MSGALLKHLVLAIYPTSRGFAFVLFEGPQSPFDWGMKEFKGRKKNAWALKEAEKLVRRFGPDHLVLEDTSEPGSKRSPRIRHLYGSLVKLASDKGVEVHRYSQARVRAAFAAAGARTKGEIAEKIAKHIPAFNLWLPRARKIWMSEDQRQSLFDAIAFALVHYRTGGQGLNLEAA